MAVTYSHEFFGVQATTAAERIVALVHEWLSPTTVLDVGCGLGVWLDVWQKHGCEVLGLDGDYIDRTQLKIESVAFRPTKLEEPVDLGRTFDLVMSLEVAEHLDEGRADVLLDSIVRHGDAVLFSAAIPGQGGEHHVNCQWQSHWRAKFEARGYEPFDLVRPRIWDQSDIVWWYRQNIVLYARGSAAEQLRAVPLPAPPFDLVHPQWYEDRTADLSLRQETVVWLRAARAAARRRLGHRVPKLEPLQTE